MVYTDCINYKKFSFWWSVLLFFAPEEVIDQSSMSHVSLVTTPTLVAQAAKTLYYHLYQSPMCFISQFLGKFRVDI